MKVFCSVTFSCLFISAQSFSLANAPLVGQKRPLHYTISVHHDPETLEIKDWLAEEFHQLEPSQVIASIGKKMQQDHHDWFSYACADGPVSLKGLNILDDKAALARPAYGVMLAPFVPTAAAALGYFDSYHAKPIVCIPSESPSPLSTSSREQVEWFSQAFPEVAPTTTHNHLKTGGGGGHWFAQATIMDD